MSEHVCEITGELEGIAGIFEGYGSVRVLGPHPKIPDVWMCVARGGQIQLHPVLCAMTCRAYECRYRLRDERGGHGRD